MVLGIRSEQSVLVGVDFAAVFDRTCDPNVDYEDWNPRLID